MKTSNSESLKGAIILHFPRRRGRPKSVHHGIDRGTPELAQKRLRGETTETLDLCLERGLITPQQHWCGIHLRWLYTLRYGAPGVRSIDPTHTKGMDIKTDDPKWRSERESEYSEAVKKLTQSGYAIMLMNICIYNERPPFLSVPSRLREHRKATGNVGTLCDGLDMLRSLWNNPS